MKKVKEYQGDWLKLRAQLDNNYDLSDDWREAVSIFEGRMKNYFLRPVMDMDQARRLDGEGFAIVTIACALIEMFAAFREGKIYKHDKVAGDAGYYYSGSKKCFVDFLESESIFQDHFFTLAQGAPQPGLPFSAGDFYSDVRCGLMHEARTKGDWKINAKALSAYNGNETIFITEDNGDKVIDRAVLLSQLRVYFAKYLNELTADTPESNILRRLFARKMDHLFDVAPANNVDWWEDR